MATEERRPIVNPDESCPRNSTDRKKSQPRPFATGVINLFVMFVTPETYTQKKGPPRTNSPEPTKKMKRKGGRERARKITRILCRVHHP